MRILKMEARGLDWEVEVYRTEKDCWRDCDFPSECLGLEKQGRVSIGAFSSLLSLDGPQFGVAANGVLKDFEEGESKDGSGVDVEMVDVVADDDDGWKDMVTEEVWGEEEDDDEDGVEMERKRRKKSIQKIQQLTGVALNTDIPLVVPTNLPESPPSSPLKMFVSVDEEDWAEQNVWELDADDVANDEKRGSGDSVDSVDSQLKELMEARNLFLRNFEEGDESGDVLR